MLQFVWVCCVFALPWEWAYQNCINYTPQHNLWVSRLVPFTEDQNKHGLALRHSKTRTTWNSKIGCELRFEYSSDKPALGFMAMPIFVLTEFVIHQRLESWWVALSPALHPAMQLNTYSLNIIAATSTTLAGADTLHHWLMYPQKGY